MNKFSIYILLILVFLGVSKSFSPSEQRLTYIENEYVYANVFKSSPLEIILVDYFKAGFIIKTYFHRYKIIHGFKNPEFVTVRVSKKFWLKNRDYVGMSLFRRRELDGNESTTPLPPGALFLGDPSFGFWEENLKEQKKLWFFHRAYKQFPEHFSWGNFKPSQDFYRQLNTALAQNKVFFGSQNEFGTKSEHARKMYSEARVFNPTTRIHYKELIDRFISGPWKEKSP